MRVLITGAAGFLGSHFSRAHVAAGDEVVGIDDWSGDIRYEYTDWGDNGWMTEMAEVQSHLDPPHTWNHAWIIREDCLSFFARSRERFDLAYHFAAPVGGRVKIEGDPLFNAHSLALDSAFFRWAIQHAEVAVYPSSSAVYGVYFQGRFPAPKPLAEDMCDPQKNLWWKPDEMYGFTKLAGEMLAFKAAKYGLNTLCIRPFSGYGEGQSLDYPVPAIAARALSQDDPLQVWGSDQKRDFIHVDDIVRITRLALKNVSGYQALNLGSGSVNTFTDVASIYAGLVGYDPKIINVPGPEGVWHREADIKRQLTVSSDTLIPLTEGLGRVLEDVGRRLRND